MNHPNREKGVEDADFYLTIYESSLVQTLHRAVLGSKCCAFCIRTSLTLNKHKVQRGHETKYLEKKKKHYPEKYVFETT